MIDPKELRLTNAVRWANHGPFAKDEIFYIQSLEPLESKIEDENGAIIAFGIPYEELIPVHLTPEILQQCGFTKGETISVNKLEKETLFTHEWGDNSAECNKVIEIYGSVPNEFWRVKVNGDIIFIHYKMAYLHQLQNLYYSLTGQELEIKIPQTT